MDWFDGFELVTCVCVCVCVCMWWTFQSKMKPDVGVLLCNAMYE
jgi:hypothetical protein